MSSKGKPGESKSSVPSRTASSESNQLEFEIDFFQNILERNPNFIDVLRVLGNNLTIKGRWEEGLKIDKRLVRLRPADPLAHYNLACSFSLLKKSDSAFKALRKAMNLGYRDFRFIEEDRDLDHIRKDPRFTKLIEEFQIS